MTKLRFIIAAGLTCAAALTLSGTAAADGKQMSGWDCVALYGHSRDAYPFSTGGMSNPKSSVLDVGCPLVQDDRDVDDLKIYVVDRSSTDGFTCFAAHIDLFGGGAWGPSKTTSNGFLGNATLDWDDAEIGGAGYLNLVRCDVPAKTSSGQSAIRSLHWDESCPNSFFNCIFKG